MNRHVHLLATAQGLLLTNNIVFIAINGLVGMQMAPRPWMATLPVMGYVVGGALATGAVARVQRRWGRQVSFQSGLAVALGSALLCALAAWIGSFWLLLAATVVAGYYSANGQLYRFAAAELAPPAERERAVSRVLAGGLIGAVAGPNLASHTRDLLLPRLVERGKAYAHQLDGYWRDLGQPHHYLNAHLELVRQQTDLFDPAWPVIGHQPQTLPARIEQEAEVHESLISPGCVVGGRVIRSVLAPGVVIEPGADVMECVIGDGVRIRAGAKAWRSIIDHGAELGPEARVGSQDADLDDPDAVAVIMQGFLGSKLAGTCTMRVTFLRPVPSSANAMYSVPATLPSPVVTLPCASTLGP